MALIMSGRSSVSAAENDRRRRAAGEDFLGGGEMSDIIPEMPLFEREGVDDNDASDSGEDAS